MLASGREAIQITPNVLTRDVPQESPEGEFLYYFKDEGYPMQCSGWKMPGGGGEETKVLDSVHCNGHWAVGKHGICFFTETDKRGHSEIRFFEFTTGKTGKIQTIERGVAVPMGVSPDGRTILYTQNDQVGSNLMVVENF